MRESCDEWVVVFKKGSSFMRSFPVPRDLQAFSHLVTLVDTSPTKRVSSIVTRVSIFTVHRAMTPIQ
jgi:hypothetical protein